MQVYYDRDAKPEVLRDRKIAIIGYGSQGHAHANNLKDGGYDVIVGEKKGAQIWKKAEDAGFQVFEASEAASRADVVMLLVPDELMGDLYKEEIESNLKEGVHLGFAHGFNIHFKEIVPSEKTNVFMVAPKGPGHLVRRQYKLGQGVPTLIAVFQDPSKDTLGLALAYACGIGSGKAGIIETTFKEETETDLFGEQVVLCGGITALVQAAFDVLVEAGYSPEMAYFECLHELKLIVDLLYEGGITNMRYSVSNTAQFGDLTRGPRVIDDRVRQEMVKILGEVQSGEFAKEWIAENRAGKPLFNSLTKKGEEHPIEKVGLRLRAMMPWLQKDKLVDKSKN
ncbi:MAG: ketol-acid reductoisomerase [Deltaproteobacteria bacterium]|nr:ketol-acid reductoisomerase [Deltaproteobacteria bacterium]